MLIQINSLHYHGLTGAVLEVHSEGSKHKHTVETRTKAHTRYEGSSRSVPLQRGGVWQSGATRTGTAQSREDAADTDDSL
eukprot:6185572-Pleurochrysis_carterae.AAC.4